MDPIDNLAQSLLIGLVICSTMSDGYIMIKNLFHDKKTLENMEYYQDVLKAVSSYGLDKYEKEEDGSIIVADQKTEKKEQTEEIKQTNKIEKEEMIKENIKMKTTQLQIPTPWEAKGMTKEEYDLYKMKKKKERSDIENREHKSIKKDKEKHKSFPNHK